MDAIAAALRRLEQRRPVRALLGFLRDRLTPAGRAVLLLWWVAATFAQSSLNAPIYRLWAFASAALVVAGLAAWWSLPRLTVRRLPVAPTTAGGEAVVEVEVVNKSRRVVRDLAILERWLPPKLRALDAAPVTVARLGPGERVVLATRLRADARGAYELAGLHVASTFPLGLWRAMRAHREVASLLVYPAFATPNEFAVPAGRNYQPGGFLLSSKVGESSEFMHTREYRSGDNPRHVHWASTARLGRPIVKVYHEEYFVRMALVLDTEVGTGRERGTAAFEAAISTAAGIADYLSRREYIIDLFAAGASVYHFQAGRALANFEHVLQILACIEPAPAVDWQAVAEALLPEVGRLTGVVALFTDWSPARDEVVTELRARGVAVSVIVVRDAPLSAPAPILPPEQFVHLRSDEELMAAAQLGSLRSGT